jgi:prefoldin subunit 5
MTDTQIQDIYSRIDALTVEVNSLKTQIGVVGTTQYAVVQILNRLERVENTQANHTEVLANHTILLNEILHILRDRNGGSGL